MRPGLGNTRTSFHAVSVGEAGNQSQHEEDTRTSMRKCEDHGKQANSQLDYLVPE